MNKLKKRVINKKGFTLIELIVVIAILGILAAILIPQFTGFQNKAKATQALVDAKQIATAIDGLLIEGTTPSNADNGNVETLSGVDIGTKLSAITAEGYFTYTIPASGSTPALVAGRSAASLGKVVMNP